MTFRFLSILVLSVFWVCSCQNPPKKQQATTSSVPDHEPNFNYVIEVPTGWSIKDTIFQENIRIRLLLPPQSLNADFPSGNVLIANMGNLSLSNFTARNIVNIKTEMAGITILENGSIDSAKYNGQWFTYLKDQNGVSREMINYIIPLNGFAYMITCGSNKGSFYKYRETFDKIARSFRG